MRTMINERGYYLTACGETVEITRILEKQNFAEGYVHHNGERSIWCVWNIDGRMHRYKDNEHDIVQFLYGHFADESSYD